MQNFILNKTTKYGVICQIFLTFARAYSVIYHLIVNDMSVKTHSLSRHNATQLFYNKEVRLRIMKRIVILVLVVLMTSTTLFAQEKRDNWRRKYADFGFINTTMSSTDIPNLTSNYGLSFSVGRVFYLHHRPIFRHVRLGVDVTWLDMNYTNYQIMQLGRSSNTAIQYEQMELAAAIGPSVTIRTSGSITVHGYVKYAPTASVLYANDIIYNAYSPFIVNGIAVVRGKVGIGLESRTFMCDYDEWGSAETRAYSIDKVNYNGWKAYLTVSF